MDAFDRREAKRRALSMERTRQGQQVLHPDSEVAARWGQEHPEAFGGLWFENDDSEAGTGPVRLAVAIQARTSNAVVESLRARLQHPDLLTVVACPYALRELESAASGIRRRYMPDRHDPSSSPAVRTLAVDVRRNRIEVGMAEADDETAAAIREELGDIPVVFDPGVQVVPAAAS